MIVDQLRILSQRETNTVNNAQDAPSSKQKKLSVHLNLIYAVWYDFGVSGPVVSGPLGGSGKRLAEIWEFSHSHLSSKECLPNMWLFL